MKILGIETSCDETALSIIEVFDPDKKFKVLAHSVASQTALHAPWGGVVPGLAKREHSKNLIPLLEKTLRRAGLYRRRSGNRKIVPAPAQNRVLKRLLVREPELLADLQILAVAIEPPAVDLIAVTVGPGLEPALWTGINLAKALNLLWRQPLAAVNHLEGHIASVLAGSDGTKISFPALALIVSGGHTELVLVSAWNRYRLLGATRDDACGEAFDKAARILGLDYPGGPALAALARAGKTGKFSLPRPMLQTKDFDFSFSGLKTAILYLVKKEKPLDAAAKAAIAAEFQQAVIDILLAKTDRAITRFRPKSLIVSGGVSANRELRRQFRNLLARRHPRTRFFFPPLRLTTDNATMIALAAAVAPKKNASPRTLRARGTLNF